MPIRGTPQLLEALKMLGITLPPPTPIPDMQPGTPGYDPTTFANRIDNPSMMDPTWLNVARTGVNTARRVGEMGKGLITGGSEEAGPNAENLGAILGALGPLLGATIRKTPKTTLWRASDYDTLPADNASFAARRADAEAYMRNTQPGFGGRRLFKSEVRIDPDKVLDVSKDTDMVGAISKAIGEDLGGEHTAAGWVPRMSEQIKKSGYDWVHLRDTFPEDADVWIWTGPSDREPVLREIGKRASNSPTPNVELFKPKETVVVGDGKEPASVIFGQWGHPLPDQDVLVKMQDSGKTRVVKFKDVRRQVE